jgi:cytochrome c oxidase subunit 2
MSFHSGIVAPQGVWWRQAGKQERVWVAIAFAWCLVLFAMMPFWHIKGGQNPSGIRSRVVPGDFYARTNQMIADHQIGEAGGMPLVAPPAGADVYLMAQMWRWFPAIQLEAGKSYTLHLSALDVNHGFSLYPANINFQVVPGYDYGLRITPNNPGEYRIICNEFCGIGHHAMLGRIVVVEPGAPRVAASTPPTAEEVIR